MMVFTFVFRVVLIVVYLEFLFPLLATFRPLPDGPLKTKIKGLADRVGFPLYDIYIMQGK